MSLEENKALVRRLLEQEITHGAEAALAASDALRAPDFVAHFSTDRTHTRDEYREALAEMKRAFTEEQLTVHHLVAEGDLVVARYTAAVTHTGEIRGHPPTGRRVRYVATVVSRIAGGRIAEAWEQTNRLDFLRQLGVLPDDLLRERGVPVPPPAPPPPADA
jgi:predicted ester cyclase